MVLDKIYFELVGNIIITVADSELSTDNEIIERPASSVEEPWDLIGRSREYIDVPASERPARDIYISSPSKRWFDRLRIAQAELTLVTSLELSSQIEAANLNVNRIRSEFNTQYNPSDNILSPTGLEEA